MKGIGHETKTKLTIRKQSNINASKQVTLIQCSSQILMHKCIRLDENHTQ